MNNKNKRSDKLDSKSNSTIWGGRFDAGPTDLMESINSSIDFDQRLYKQDIAVYVIKKFNEMTKAMMLFLEKSNKSIINVQYMDLIRNKNKTIKLLSEKCEIDIKNTLSQKKHNFNKLKSKVINETIKLGINSDEIYFKFDDYINKFNIIKE